MPTIPLLKPNLELAMPKVPALDRVPRPQIDLSGVLDKNIWRYSIGPRGS